MPTRAVLYARVSRDDRQNDGRNLHGQIDMAEEYAQQRGYEIVARLPEDDKGASGAEIDLPKLNQIREMAQAGAFDVLVVREIDRLSRSLAKQLIVEEELKRWKVHIEYVLGEYSDTPEGNLQKHIKAVIAEYERAKITERVNRGKRLKVKAGSVMVAQRPPYGYDAVEQDGHYTLQINEAHARVVRLIFQWYTSGDGSTGPLSLEKITLKLRVLGIPTPTDGVERNVYRKWAWGKWRRRSVNNILQNETYTGVWYYGKQTRDSNRRLIDNPREQWIAVDVPAIVEREQWNMAQQQRQSNRKYSTRNTRRDYLFAKLVTCGHCGRPVGSVTYNARGYTYSYYRCPAFNSRTSEYDEFCDLPGFRADHVDAQLWAWLREQFLDPVKLEEGFKVSEARIAEEASPIQTRLQVVDDLLTDYRRQLRRLLNLYLAEKLPEDIYLEKQAELAGVTKSLDRERQSLSERLNSQEVTQEQLTIAREFARRVATGIVRADQSFEGRRQLVIALRPTVTLTVTEGKRMAHIRCPLGNHLLNLQGGETTQSTPSDVVQAESLSHIARRSLPGRGRPDESRYGQSPRRGTSGCPRHGAARPTRRQSPSPRLLW